MSRPTTEVAVGVVLQPDGRVLLADRPAGKAYAGHWEFPGGKLEPGESVHDALARELHEELGITIRDSTPWVTFEYDYPHAYVRLYFRRVTQWRGEPHAREGQRIGFFAPEATLPAPLLPAAIPVLRWLRLPVFYGISAASSFASPEEFLRRVEHALASGLRLIQLREPALPPSEVARLFTEVRLRAAAAGAQVLFSSRHQDALGTNEADGIHLTSAELMALTARPPASWVGASIHNADELAQAVRVGCDFAMLGPVLPTPSHPGAPTLGWTGFEALARNAPLPVYAVGGLGWNDLARAQHAGAHGVAMLSQAWSGAPR